MITDARVLDTEFVPSDILHRHDELNALSASVASVLEQGFGGRSYVFGPSGAGKTCLARFMLEDLRTQRLDVNTQYINAWRHHSPFAFLYQLADGVGQTYDVRQQSTTHDELLERVEQHDDHIYVVVIDEVDQLDQPQLLYDLERMPHVHQIFIANAEEQFFDGLDDRLVSRLQAGRRVTLPRYTDDEVRAIVESRAEGGLEFGAVADGTLDRIAEVADGDARCAIEVLREAARHARDAGDEQVSVENVAAAEPTARENLRQKTVSNLTRHQTVLYELLQAADGALSMGELYPQYTDSVDEPKSRKTCRRYLTKLAQYNLIHAEGENRGRSYRT